MKNKHVIILVDDEELILKSLCRELHHSDRELICFLEVNEALAYIATNEVDLVISDYRMPKIDGVEFLTKVKNINFEIISIILSGNSDFHFLKDAVNNAGIYKFISKPWGELELRNIVACALELRDLRIKNKELADQIREKNNHILNQQKALEKLEAINPGITQVDRDTDGAILIDEKYMQ